MIELIDKTCICFNKKTKQFVVGSLLCRPIMDCEQVLITHGTFLRISHKAQIVAAIKKFLQDTKVNCLESDRMFEGSHDCFWGLDCQCLVNGYPYTFYTEEESFIPICVQDDHKSSRRNRQKNGIPLSKSEFLTLMVYRIFHKSISVALSDKKPEEYVEFTFYKDGYATDGTGLRYTGIDNGNCHLFLTEEDRAGWRDRKIHLVPAFPVHCADDVGDKFEDFKSEAAEVSVGEFIDICAERETNLREYYQGEFQRMISSERDFLKEEDRQASREINDLMDSGLMDIYGEPGGWQFNNED